ncbi:MAG: MFS transporter [Muribaculaceae bacterium]
MKNKNFVFASLMMCFFAMGFVDLVGIASNYVKADLGLSDSLANVFPSLVFFWFLIFSVPTGLLMNKIGRKSTVQVSLVVTVLSLAMALVSDSFVMMLISFSLLGIGNALMQVSLNPLMAMVTGGGAKLASTLTFGQFVKAIASFMAPYLALWGAMGLLPVMGLGWKVLFLIYLVVGVLSWVCLWSADIIEGEKEKSSSVKACFGLLRRPLVLLSFIGIMCHVGIDVGTNTTAPKLLMERLGWSLNEAAFTTSLYFIFRTIGCFTGSILLRVVKVRTFFVASVLMMAMAMAGMMFGNSEWVLYCAIALVGYGNSNVFSIMFAGALGDVPDRQSEVSGLMIMGLFGGTVFPLIMGIVADATSQVGAVAVMAVGVIYLITYINKITI